MVDVFGLVIDPSRFSPADHSHRADPFDGVAVDDVVAVLSPVGRRESGDQRPVGRELRRHVDQLPVPPVRKARVGIDLKRVLLAVVEPLHPVPGPASSLAVTVVAGGDKEPVVALEVVEAVLSPISGGPSSSYWWNTPNRSWSGRLALRMQSSMVSASSGSQYEARATKIRGVGAAIMAERTDRFVGSTG